MTQIFARHWLFRLACLITFSCTNASAACTSDISGTIAAANCTAGSTTGGIQEAINALPATGGTVILPLGSTTVYSQISVQKPLVLTGQGAGGMNENTNYVNMTFSAGTTLVNSTGTDMLVVSLPTSGMLGGVVIRDFSINANKTASGLVIRGGSTPSQSLRSVIVQDVLVHDAAACNLKITDNAYMLTLRGLQSYKSAGAGVCVTSSTSGIPGQIWVYGLISDLNAGDAFKIDSSTGGSVNIYGGTLSDSANGLHVTAASANAQVRLYGVHFEGNTTNGALLEGGYGHLIDGCEFIGDGLTQVNLNIANSPVSNYFESSAIVRGSEFNSTAAGGKDISISSSAKNVSLAEQTYSQYALLDNGYGTRKSVQAAQGLGNCIAGVCQFVNNTSPSGACVSGSTYANTGGAAGSTFYVCVAGAWANVK